MLKSTTVRRLRAHLGGPLLAATLVSALACGSSKPEGRVLAKVGDHEITAEEFEAYLRFKRIVVRSPKEADEQLESYVKRAALAEAAARSNKLDQAAIDVELAEFRKEMLTSRYLESYLRTAVSHEQVERYYKEHQSEYQDRRVHVAHILVRAPRNMPEEERKAARAKIDEAKAQLDQGKDFGELAQALSEDRVTGNRGGDMGQIREGAIDPRFSEAAFALSAGQVSAPVETAFGFHLIRAIEAPVVHTQPLTAVESDIRYKLRAEAKEREVARLEKTVPTELKRGDYMPSAQKPAQDTKSAKAEN